MKFTKTFIRKNKGCYTLKQVNQLSFINNKVITLDDIINSEISIQDKFWFLYNNCNFTYAEKVKVFKNNKKLNEIYISSSWVCSVCNSWSAVAIGSVGLSNKQLQIILGEFTKYLNKRQL